MLSFLFISEIYAQYQEYHSEIYVSENGDSLLYRQLNPQEIEEGEKYPLVLFLHGAGERGDDNISQLRHGAMMFTNPVNREKYPCFVLFPQCPADLYWPTPRRPDNFQDEFIFPADAEISKPLALVKELLDKTIQTYPFSWRRRCGRSRAIFARCVFEIEGRESECGIYRVPRSQSWQLGTGF